ncbi:hypothetical protein ACFORH_30300 [Amycolatopsis roodepoortensis]|uniref:Uncharacterized protein n=1 Tax=Amycolatopsis roodepoortensis TaxID=700274 RepID=A0ABR9KX99_9PSEU|nr:hypothetical protein [Amycolatopsis roodepoortensis]MBE1572987.1 hypothetical protein [Amycolatopsis roodepoortensis]
MVEPLIALFGKKVVDTTADLLVAAGDRKTRRHDLSVEGAEPTSDLDLIVDYTLPYWRGAKAPVEVILRRIEGSGANLVVRMVLRETARLRLRRGTYDITATVLELSPVPDGAAKLHAVGTDRVWLGENRTRKVRIRPAPVLVQAPKPLKAKRSGAKPVMSKAPRKASAFPAPQHKLPDPPPGGQRIGQRSDKPPTLGHILNRMTCFACDSPATYHGFCLRHHSLILDILPRKSLPPQGAGPSC